jgi:O-antigen/teichoic acid export membrane protein
MADHFEKWRRYSLIVIASVGVAAAAGHVLPPPDGETGSAQVQVVAAQPQQLVAAAVPTLAVPPIGGTAAFSPSGGLGPGWFLATSDSEAAALATALGAARRYVRSLVRAQGQWLAHAGPASSRSEHARRRLQREPGRYMLLYTEARTASSPSSGGAGRGALIGLLVAAVALAVLEGRKRPTPSSANGGDIAFAAGPSGFRRLTPLAGAAVASVLLVAAAAAGPAPLYSLVVFGLLFGAAAVFVYRGRDTAVVVALAAIVLLSPFRGALLALAGVVHLPHALVTVNALQPCLIAAIALVAALELKRLPTQTARMLAVAWIAIAVAAVLDLLTQTVGLKVYAIGLVQYLAYPTLALLALPVLRRRDIERFAVALVALGVAVACSIFLEAAHAVRFVEAVPPIDPVTGTGRYGGSTGSYLHASIFLGTAAPIALGFVLAKRSTRQRALAGAALATIFAGFVLTYSRGGAAISAAAVLVLLCVLGGRQRAVLAATGAVAVVFALAAGFAAGISPEKVGTRMASSFALHSDPSNSLRLHDMKNALRRFEQGTLPQKVLGQGLAATGNTRKLAGLQPVSTESYVLKLLVEVGVLGMVAIGAVLAWALVVFLGLAWRARGRPELQSLAAAGVGLTLYAAIFPTLEPQLTALTWWLLLVLGLKALGAEPGPVREAAATLSAAPRFLERHAALLARLIRAPRSRFAAITVAGTLGGALAALAAAIVAARALDQSQFVLFGVGLAANSLIVQLADLGLTTVTVAETAADWASDRIDATREKLRRLAWHRFWSAGAIAGAAAIVGAAVPGLGAYRDVILIVSFGSVFGSVSLFVVALIQGAQRFRTAAAVQWTIGLARLLLVGACAAAGAGSSAMLVMYTAVAPLLGIVHGWVTIRASSDVRSASARPAHVSLDRKLIGAMTVGGVASACLLNADVLLLVLLSTRSEVAAYIAAWRIAAGVLLLNAAVAYALLPSVMVAPGSRHEARRLIKTGVAVAALIILLAPLMTVVGLAVFGAAGQDAGPALAILLVAFGLDAFIVIVYQIYLRISRAAVIAATAVSELVTMVCVTIVLREHGSLAPAIGQLSARVIGVMIVTVPLIIAWTGRLSWFSPDPDPPARLNAETRGTEVESA